MTHSQQTTTNSIASQHVDAPIDNPAFHLDVLAELSYDADVDGAVPLASDPDNRYPYVYPRDVASITRAWLTVLRHNVRPDECRDRIVEAARFLIAAQDNGWWYQRYGLDGEDQSIYQQEDNVAHGIRILSHAVLAFEESGELEPADTAFLMSIVDCIEAAVTVTRSELYDANAHLIESTTSIHRRHSADAPPSTSERRERVGWGGSASIQFSSLGTCMILLHRNQNGAGVGAAVDRP